MKKSARQNSAKKTSVREARVDYAPAVTVRAIYRQGKLELQNPVADLEENEVVELIIQPESATDPKQRAIEILRQAKLRAIEQVHSMTLEDAQSAYDRAAVALRKELRKK